MIIVCQFARLHLHYEQICRQWTVSVKLLKLLSGMQAMDSAVQYELLKLFSGMQAKDFAAYYELLKVQAGVQAMV